MSMSNEQRLTAEEFREKIMAAYTKHFNGVAHICDQSVRDMAIACGAICASEKAHRDELAAMDFDDCEGGACKL